MKILLFLIFVFNFIYCDSITTKNFKKFFGDLLFENSEYVSIRTSDSIYILNKKNIFRIERDYCNLMYCRYSNKNDLETAIKKFKFKNKTVSLVSVIHFADSSYYDKIQCFLDSSQIVLYESIGNSSNIDLKTIRLSNKREMGNKRQSESFIEEYNELSRKFGLVTQMSQIYYQRDFFFNIDCSLEQYYFFVGKRKFEYCYENKEIEKITPFKEFLDREYLDKKNYKLDSDRIYKQAYAKYISYSNVDIKDPLYEALVLDRNNVAIANISNALANDSIKDISVFYGAGHMISIEKFLISVGFNMVEERWLVAWDI